MNCKICSLKYNKSDRKPYLLTPCGHTYCQTCISDLKEQDIKYTCPKCNKRVRSHTLNSDLLEMLGMNLIVDVNAELRQSVEKDLKEIKKLKKKLQASGEQKQNDLEKSVNMIRTQMNERFVTVQTQLSGHKELLVAQVDDLEKSIIHSIDELRSDNKEEVIGSVNSIDQMDRTQLNDFKKELNQIKKNLSAKSKQLDEIVFNHEFKSSQIIVSNIIGSIVENTVESVDTSLQEAKQKIKEAESHENKNNLDTALGLYREAIEKIQSVLRSDSVPPKTRQSLKELCDRYACKADKLNTLASLTQKFYNKKRSQSNDENEDPEIKKKFKHSSQPNLNQLIKQNTNELGKSFDFVIERIAKNLFIHFDQEETNKIGFNCFKQIVEIFTLPECIDLNKLKADFSQADTNKDGKINLEEFLHLFVTD